MTTIAISKPALLSLLGAAQEPDVFGDPVRLTWRCGCHAYRQDLSYLWRPCRGHRKGDTWADFSSALSA